MFRISMMWWATAICLETSSFSYGFFYDSLKRDIFRGLMMMWVLAVGLETSNFSRWFFLTFIKKRHLQGFDDYVSESNMPYLRKWSIRNKKQIFCTIRSQRNGRCSTISRLLYHTLALYEVTLGFISCSRILCSITFRFFFLMKNSDSLDIRNQYSVNLGFEQFYNHKDSFHEEHYYHIHYVSHDQFSCFLYALF